MRVCWNWQTGTFEGRVSTTYGFKSRHSHQETQSPKGWLCFFVHRDLNPKRAKSVKKKLPVASFLAFYCAGGYCEQCGAVAKQGRLQSNMLSRHSHQNRQDLTKSCRFYFLPIHSSLFPKIELVDLK